MITYAIDAVRGMVVVTLTGVLTVEEVGQYRDRIAADPDFRASLLPLFDVRGTTASGLSQEAIQTMAAGIVFSSGRQAYLVANDLQFGVVRMFGAFAKIERQDREIRPFRDMEAAQAWLLSGI